MGFRMLCAALLSAGVLVACGGGGGGGAAGGGNGDPVPTGSDVSVSGSAAKGLIANAIVTAHAINADGSVAPAALASTTTDTGGRYTLTFKGSYQRPYVLKVTAQASTTHLDEVTGQTQSLLAGFVMRALITAGPGGMRSNLTPFSEMTVAAAEKSSGGITTANAQKAVSMMTQLLGFNPALVEITSTDSATSSPDEQKLAIMLTAVSQLANSGALGCNTGGHAVQVKCVVEILAKSSSADTLALSTPTINVAGSLLTAVDAVFLNSRLAGRVPRALLATIRENLVCAGPACTPVPATIALNAAEGIAAAKALFTSIRSDWAALFGLSSKAAAPGEVQAQLDEFRSSMQQVQLPAEMLLKDTSVVLMGIDLYQDYRAGRTGSISVSRWQGKVAGEPAWLPDQAVGSAGICTLFADSGLTVLATPGQANYIGCNAYYYYTSFFGTPVTRWRHRFGLAPSATEPGTFSYSSRAQTVTFAAAGTTVSNSTGPSTGTFTTTTDGAGHVTGFTATGQLPGAYESGGTRLISHHHDWNLSGSRVFSSADPTAISSTISGQLLVKAADNAVQATLNIAPGSGFTEAGGEISGFDMGLSWSTPTSAFEGRFAATDPVLSKTQTERVPSKLVLDGKLRNLVTGTQFLTGKLTVDIGGYEKYVETQPTSSTNFFNIDLGFVATVTAPNRPLLQFSVGTAMKSYEDSPSSVSLQYRTLVSGVTRTAVNLVAFKDNAGLVYASLSEPSSGLSMNIKEGATSADLLLSGSTKLGVLNNKSGILTFSDGSFISLDMAP